MPTSFPDFLIVGAAKSGTTTLHQLLKEHSDIYMPERKELNFWYTHGRDDWAILKRFPDLPKSLEDYLTYFDTDKKIKGEASPGYLAYHTETIQNIKALHPNYQALKIIIILREPIAKIWSHFKMVERAKMDPDGYNLWNSLKNEEKRKDNKKYLLDTLPLFSTDYLTQVKAFKANFEQVQVLLFDDLVTSPQEVLNEITTFLEVSPLVLEPTSSNNKYNAAPPKAFPNNIVLESLRKIGLNKLFSSGLKEKIVKRWTREKPMDKRTKKLLINRYKEDVKELQDLIDQDLSSWLNKYN